MEDERQYGNGHATLRQPVGQHLASENAERKPHFNLMSAKLREPLAADTKAHVLPCKGLDEILK